jgi:hypothetical protein
VKPTSIRIGGSKVKLLVAIGLERSLPGAQVWPLFRALVLDAIFHSVPAPNSVQLASADCKYRIPCILLSDYRRIMSCATKVC